jgi:hypothetical protein
MVISGLLYFYTNLKLNDPRFQLLASVSPSAALAYSIFQILQPTALVLLVVGILVAIRTFMTPETADLIAQGDVYSLTKRLEELEAQETGLRRTIWSLRRLPSRMTSYILLLLGALVFMGSIFLNVNSLAFIGLGLTFWGAILLYVTPSKFVKSEILDSLTRPLLQNMDHLLKLLDVQSTGIYFSTAGNSFSDTKLIIPSKTSQDNALMLIPPGLELAMLIEKELEIDFTTVDLNYLRDNLPQAYCEALELLNDLDIAFDEGVRVTMRQPVNGSVCFEVRKLNLCPTIGCSLCSSIACILTRITSKPVLIEKVLVSPDDSIESYYRIVEG